MICPKCDKYNIYLAENCVACGHDFSEKVTHEVEVMSELKEKPKGTKKIVPSFKMGEEIKNGIRFWRGKGHDKHGSVLMECICPNCGELFTARYSDISSGKLQMCRLCKTKMDM